ncbi:MAG TPA: acyl-CoA dehydrogenase family protein [Solirubrobacterales bacterium]|nr:acyl-CoA dehydrogenase family protein [Solirubrobacterales bacterium]
MRLGPVAELERFRAEVREFLAAEAPEIPERAGFRSPADEAEDAVRRAWRARLYEVGYLGADWPERFGGGSREWNPVLDLVVSEEVARAGLPPLTDQTHLAAFALLRFGDAAQQERYLPAIRAGRETWCQLFSEPDAGSDLAAMRTVAEPLPGGGYRVEGQKVWSSNAAWAEFGFLLARTDPSAERHRGISAFVVPMDASGLEIRPLREITGSDDFSEVFMEGVELGPEALLGAREDGWRVAMESLGAERSGIGAGGTRLRQMLDSMVALAAVEGEDGARPADSEEVRDRIAGFAAEIEVNNLLVQQRLSRELRGAERPADVPIGKLVFSELNLAMAAYGMRLQGSHALLTEGDPEALQAGRWQDEYLYARTFTVAGGASEIMRNIVAERALGMPRERRGG